MIQRTGGLFPVNPSTPPVLPNTRDGGPVVIGGWSYGATLIFSPGFQPPSLEVWEIQAVSITAKLCLAVPAAPTIPLYGKLGKVVAAVLPQGATSTAHQGQPDSGMIPLPQDSTLSVDLFDPAVDMMPPLWTSSITTPPSEPAGMLPLQSVISLPIGQGSQSAANLALGLWITPSLLHNTATQSFGLALFGAAYTIIYDDGKPTPHPL